MLRMDEADESLTAQSVYRVQPCAAVGPRSVAIHQGPAGDDSLVWSRQGGFAPGEGAHATRPYDQPRRPSSSPVVKIRARCRSPRWYRPTGNREDRHAVVRLMGSVQHSSRRCGAGGWPHYDPNELVRKSDHHGSSHRVPVELGRRHRAGDHEAGHQRRCQGFAPRPGPICHGR